MKIGSHGTSDTGTGERGAPEEWTYVDVGLRAHRLRSRGERERVPEVETRDWSRGCSWDVWG